MKLDRPVNRERVDALKAQMLAELKMHVKVMDYTPELYADICNHALDYHQTGWTVCGAEDPAMIYLNAEFGERHPELAEYTVVRVMDVYVNPSKSDTLLEFSNRDLTDEEYKLYEAIMSEEE